ncbi:MAG: hypothetical protein V4592_04795 [Bacteroidota bacterium]
MKKSLLTIIVILSMQPLISNAQNTFPSTGNVGIGTATPSYLLDVNGSSRLGDIYFNGSYITPLTTNNSLVLRANGTGGVLVNYASGTSGVAFYNGSTTAIATIDNAGNGYLAGNVGIGTASPSEKLHVIGNILASNAGGGVFRVIASTNNTAAYNLQSYSAPLYINELGNNTLINAVTAGNVGIGTTSPGAKLHVNGDELRLSYGSNWGTLNIYRSGIGNWFQTADNTSNSFSIGFNAYKFFNINTSGNIGIGTTAPDEKLTVYGKIHSQEVKVDLSIPGPDYVFEPTYKLPTLSEIKTFVDKNHHLPEIPSAAEMAKNGLDLGDMNTRLLKKVEELTLYLIEQQKQIDNLTKQISKK